MILTFPLKSSSFRWSRVEQQVPFRSSFGSQALVVAIPQWRVEMQGVPQYWQDAVATQTFIESLVGYKNQIALHNHVQPQPYGTMRGTMAFDGNHAQGATTVKIIASGQGGKTLLAGDLIGFGSGITQQVVRVMANATSDGSGKISVTVSPALRNAFTSGTAVVWDRPKALFRQASLADGIEFVAVIGNAWSLSLIEDFRP